MPQRQIAIPRPPTALTPVSAPAAVSAVIPAVFLATLLAALLAAPVPAGAEVRHAARDKVDRGVLATAPPGPRVPLDCTSALDTLDVAIGLADTLRDDTTGGVSVADGYGCDPPWNETGPEHVYRLEVSEEVELQATLGELAADLDLFLLTDCESDACAASANLELAARVSPGVYYLVVDGYAGAEGSYALAVTARAPDLPAEICEPNDFVKPIASAQNVVIEDADNLYGKPDRVRLFDCSPTLMPGGEVWYAITLPDSGAVSANVQELAPALDIALWLFDGCGDTASCLAFADAGRAGETEKLEWTNLTDATATVYLAVDCFRPPDSEFDGSYTLGLDLVGAERVSFSELKSLYRGAR
jgi:hypothetical protein